MFTYIFVHLYKYVHTHIYIALYSGHGGELLTYWKRLDESLNIMASQYYTSLRKIEENDGIFLHDSKVLHVCYITCALLHPDASPEYICSLFKTVGKVIGDLGFIDEVRMHHALAHNAEYVHIRELVNSLCRDGAGPPIVCVHWKAILTRERLCST